MKNLTLDEFKRFMRIGNLLAFPFATIVVIQVLKKVNSTIGVKSLQSHCYRKARDLYQYG